MKHESDYILKNTIFSSAALALLRFRSGDYSLLDKYSLNLI